MGRKVQASHMYRIAERGGNERKEAGRG